jgi:hypothetical protein
METTQIGETQKKPKVRSIPGDPLCQGILPLVDWVKKQEETQEAECPPCDLATIAPWYRDLLEKKGYKDLAAKVQALAEGEHDTLEVASVLDEVRESVEDEEIKLELTQYDCMMQKYVEEEE